MAEERRKSAVLKRRHDWGARRLPKMRENAEELVFIDETGLNTKMTRTHGRCLKGQRLFGKAPFKRRGNQTLIAGLNRDGILAQLDAGSIVLLSPLGYSPTGEVFNLALEDVAVQADLLELWQARRGEG